MKFTKLSIVLWLVCINYIWSQNYLSADPFDALLLEYRQITVNDSLTSNNLRPIINNNYKNWESRFLSDIFYSSNYPNLENTSNIWTGKGIGNFNSLSLSHNSKYFFIRVEPFLLYSQNSNYSEPSRAPKFNVLNDNRAHTDKPFYRFGIRESQIYLKYNDFGIGWSNANNWWGDGIHNSLMLSNNTTGFGHLSIGTIQEKRINNFGFNFRYIFSNLKKYSVHKPYYNSFAILFSHHSKNILSVGFSKAVILGGNHSTAENVTFGEALFSVFNDFGIRFGETRSEVKEKWTNDDNLVVGYISYFLKKEKIKFYLELGKNDWIWDFRQFFVFPENSMAFIIGIRFYDFLLKNTFLSVEYTSTKMNKQVHINEVETWYDKEATDFFSYDGRRFTAHSGSDSDDLLISIGWHNKHWTIIPSLNYERHGLTYGTEVASTRQPLAEAINKSNDEYLPEVKYEIRLDSQYRNNDYILSVYLEFETIHNRGSVDKNVHNFLINIGFEKELQFQFFKKKPFIG